MARRPNDSQLSRLAFFILFLMAFLSCFIAYLSFSLFFRPTTLTSSNGDVVERIEEENGECCRGIEHLELWGDAVKWGSDFKLNSSQDCCFACKDLCGGGDQPCLCDSWVFCGDRVACGSHYGECWLKKQKDSFEPDRRDSGDHVMWTSGLVFGKKEGVIGLETEYGTMRVQLLPDSAPYSVSYILEILLSHHCSGCHLYRAEGRGRSWDSDGNHIKQTSYGPPYALIQGTLYAHGTTFNDIPKESCPAMRRGSVAWIGSGPDFLISLADHYEWQKDYTVFGFVLPEDMIMAEKMAQLPTKAELWSNINVAVLEKPVAVRPVRIRNTNTKRDIGLGGS